MKKIIIYYYVTIIIYDSVTILISQYDNHMSTGCLVYRLEPPILCKYRTAAGPMVVREEALSSTSPILLRLGGGRKSNSSPRLHIQLIKDESKQASRQEI